MFSERARGAQVYGAKSRGGQPDPVPQVQAGPLLDHRRTHQNLLSRYRVKTYRHHLLGIRLLMMSALEWMKLLVNERFFLGTLIIYSHFTCRALHNLRLEGMATQG